MHSSDKTLYENDLNENISASPPNKYAYGVISEGTNPNIQSITLTTIIYY